MAKFGEEGMTDVSQILTRSGAVVCERNHVVSSAISAQCMNVTDRYTDHRMVRSIPIFEIAFIDVVYTLLSMGHINTSDNCCQPGCLAWM